MSRDTHIPRILADLRGVDREEALNRLFPAVYAELRAAARAHLRFERSDHTLQATAPLPLAPEYLNWR